MTQHMITAYINIQKRARRPFDVTVYGMSMSPLLKQGDIITVQSMETYTVGDILMFEYISDNDFRVHRLLHIEDGEYQCKGDNAFLIETVSYNQIIGKITKAKRENMDIDIEFSEDKLEKVIDMSYRINKEFESLKRDTEVTKQTVLYKEYYNLFLKEEENDAKKE